MANSLAEGGKESAKYFELLTLKRREKGGGQISRRNRKGNHEQERRG